MSRISPLVNDIVGTEDADDLMIEIMDVLGSSITSSPEVGKIYVFVYQPKTQGLRYDQNPLVAVTNTYEWGFRGINFHWGQSRSYTFQEVASQLYQVTNEELQDLNTIPFAKFRINN
tara:strand:- start:165 stop:515 length:351 start_codon:yes stop_codon:yes gene_type:complete